MMDMERFQPIMGAWLQLCVPIFALALTAAAASACDVTDVDLWIGETRTDAEGHNISAVWECSGNSFGWDVEWEADTPDNDDFEGKILIGTTTVRSFTADPEDRDDSGTASVPSDIGGGNYTVKCWMKREGGEWCQSNGRTLRVVEVELECLGHDGGCYYLEDEKVCMNAQDCYKKTRWRAVKVRPVSTTDSDATVSATGPVGLVPIGGANLSELTEGDEFYVWAGAEPGGYELTLLHNKDSGCPDVKGGAAFKFKFDWTKINSSSGTGGGGAVNESAGSVDARKDVEPPAAGVQNAGYVRWHYEVRVLAEPSVYSGNVLAKASVTFNTEGKMKITNYCPPLNWKGAAIGVNFAGILSASVALQPGSTEYGSSLATADTSIQIATLPEVQLGDAAHNYLEVGFPPGLPTKSKTWTIDLSQVENDETRTYAVGATTQDLYCKVGAGSNVSLFKYWLGINISTWVGENEQTIASVEVEEYDDVFEIVP